MPLAVLCFWACKADSVPRAGDAPARAFHVAGGPASSPAAQPAPELPWARTPAATHPSLRGACDAVEALLRNILRVAVARTDGTAFENEFVRERRTGCRLTAAGTFAGSGDDPAGALADAFRAAGWVDVYGYGADGPDGSVLGLRSREALCIIGFRWDGGDDSDPTYVPADWYEAEVSCALGVPGDARSD